MDTHKPEQTGPDWNLWRKLWHTTACLLMVYVFLEWKDIREPVHGLWIMFSLAWTLAAFLVVIDLIRLHSPRINEAVSNLPFFGGIIRNVERDHFNASTYCLLAAGVLVTANLAGVLSEFPVTGALLVLAVCDPAAALIRHWAPIPTPRMNRVLSSVVFACTTCALITVANIFLSAGYSYLRIAAVAIIVSLAEAYTYKLVAILHPFTAAVASGLSSKPVTAWMTRIYPDDNLTIPLLVALLLM